MFLQFAGRGFSLSGVALCATIVLAASGPARAQSCADTQDQATMNVCAGDRFKRADARLNDDYAQIRQRLAGDDAALAGLRAAQRAWLAYRDAECVFRASGVEGGSAQPMVVAGCMDELTTARNAELAAYLACEEGDMSCPVPPAP